MNSFAFISPMLPLSRTRCRLTSVSAERPLSHRLVPRATLNTQKSLQNFSSYLLYTVTPLFLTDPLAALAQTSESADATKKIDPTQITQADLDNSLTSRILGWTALVLLLIASVGSIILSIDNFIKNREDKRNRQWVQDRIDGKPYPENMWSPEQDNTYKKGSTASAAAKGMNRESRRMEKRVKDKEQKEKKRRDKLAKERAAAKANKDETKN